MSEKMGVPELRDGVKNLIEQFNADQQCVVSEIRIENTFASGNTPERDRLISINIKLIIK